VFLSIHLHPQRQPLRRPPGALALPPPQRGARETPGAANAEEEADERRGEPNMEESRSTWSTSSTRSISERQSRAHLHGQRHSSRVV
jgi:hypothetical protein